MPIKITTDEIISRFIKRHWNIYDYSQVVYTKSSERVEIICPTHGSFFQYPSDHTKGCGCPQCGRDLTGLKKRNDTKWFIGEAKLKHGDRYDYSLSDYVTSSEKVKIICESHGVFEQLPLEHLRGKGCVKCSYEYRGSQLADNTESFIAKAIRIHGTTYNYSNVEYVDSCTHVNIECPIHGIFKQLPNLHLNNKAGCLKCGKESCGDKLRKSTGQYIADCEKVHGDKYGYDNTTYTSSQDKIAVMCKVHGTFNIRAGDHLHKGQGCKKCSSFESKPELFIENILKKHNIFYIKNDRKVLDGLELDFHIPHLNLAIEFNGLYYHSEITGGKLKDYHLNKTNLCENKGIQLIHILEDEYNDNRQLVESKIENLISATKYKIFARKCIVCEIPPKLKEKFNKKYHIQGDSQSCINLGLFYKNRLVQVMTFSKRRKALGSSPRDGEYELSRMCSLKGFNVVGGASKLLKYFERNYNPVKLISYADRRWSVGRVYHKLGFVKTHSSKPNYWYFLINNNGRKWHRYMFAKHTLGKKLKLFDPNITEWQNMRNNNYDRIWDCGNLVFEKIY